MTTLEITVGEGTSQLNLDEKRLYWDLSSPKCDGEGSKLIVFEGVGDRISVLHPPSSSTEMFVQVEQSGYDFLIKIEDKVTTVCGFKSYFTEHPGLFVTFLTEEEPSFPKLDRVSGINVDLVSYINSKVVFIVRHIKAQVERLFSIFHQERCLMQNRITQNLQTLALLSPREFAYQYFGRPRLHSSC